MSKLKDLMIKEIAAMEVQNSELRDMTPHKIMLVIQYRKKDQGYHTHYLMPDPVTAKDMVLGVEEKLRDSRVNALTPGGLAVPKSWLESD
jgi:hypothetical protein